MDTNNNTFDDERNLEEERLEKELKELEIEEQETVRDLVQAQNKEIEKAKHVKNQKLLWTNMLELRN